MFKNVKGAYIALAFLFGMLTTFIVLYAVQVNRAKRIKKQNTALLKELEGRPTAENYSKMWNALFICSSFIKPELLAEYPQIDPYTY
tara:strand:+ start:152 stop:412 length:261 start_codon:yes stop_codon:yes gene_type:complete